MLKEPPARRGFLEHDSFLKLRQELPEHLRPVLTLAFFSGMRSGEIKNLRWSNVSLAEKEIRLDAGTTKNDEPRSIPLIGELPEMLAILRQKNPDGKFVFTRNGKPLASFRKAWTAACSRAGLDGLLFHDLRRAGVRNLVRAGVPERVAMAISGHKTRAVFERYNIVSGRDLRDAGRKLEAYLNGAKAENGANSGQMHKNGATEPVAESSAIN
ncbi:MAG TPA: site-specific integrase, partial [Candidatus Acidoferrales bacterium]|nr:site-specific integrase [Candidatus Acidoferrales bacterium]